MFRWIYLGIGAFLILGFMGWSVMGYEYNSHKKAKVPAFSVAAAAAARGSSYRGGYRSRSTWFGSGSGWGK